MNDDLLTPDDQRLLDRLVDGELDDVERRNLLLRLERSSDGWRRCALAFLEAQAWRGEVRSLLAEPAPTARAKAAASKPRPAGKFRQAWDSATVWVPLAAAAGFLIAAAYTYFTPPIENAAQTTPVVLQAPQPSGSPPQPAGAATPAARPQGNIRLVLAAGPDGRPQIVEVPLVEGERLNEAMFGALPQSIPPEILQLFEQHGNQIVRERRLMPFDLEDGRRVVVPMDQLEIRPVNLQSFQ